MIKVTRSAEAAIGATPVAKYRVQVTEEHAARLDTIFRETKLAPSDWLAKVIKEELDQLGVAEPPEPEPEPEKQTTFGFEAERPV